MNKSNYFRVLFVVLTAIILVSCETVVTDDIILNGGDSRLVFEGGIERNVKSPPDQQTIRLASTVGFLEDENQLPVTDASVMVNDGNTDHEFVHIGDGVYTNSTITASLNTEYTLSIVWQGDTYTGSDRLLPVTTFERVYSEFEEEAQFTEEGYFVKFDCEDPIDEKNYYYYRVFRNGEFVIVPDPGNNITLVESDDFFNGQLRVAVNPNEEAVFELSDIATIQQLGITKAYHDFLVELFVQTGNTGLSLVGNPPPASIRGNLINLQTPSNRALGFFYATDVEEETFEITE